jgi:hypothetical protein
MLSSGAAESAGVEYRMGGLSATVEASPKETFDAASAVVRDLDLRVEKAESSDVDAEIVAYTAREKKVSVRIDALSDESSELSIRVGSLGDEDLSIRIYRQILDEL